jgi:hypothetical protein
MRGGEAYALGVVLAEGHGRQGHAESVPAWKTTENRAFLLAWEKWATGLRWAREEDCCLVSNFSGFCNDF